MTKQRSRATAVATRRRPDPNALVAHDTVGALDPEVLHAQAEASVRALLAEGESANTVRSYASALRYWAAWFRLRYRRALALPVPVPAVLQFLVDHVERTAPDGALAHDLPPAIDNALVEGGFKGAAGAPALNTALHRLSVLSKAHQMRDLPNPARDPGVQELVRRIRRAYAARGERARPKAALTQEPLQALLATCIDGLLGIRDRAILTFGFASGGRRRSEIANAVMENLVRLDADSYVYRLARSKNDPTGQGHSHQADKPLVGVAAVAINAWLDAAQIRSGPIFRRIRGSIVTHEALSGQAIWLIVRRRAALAGLLDDYGAHSLRSGFVTEAGRRNIPMKEAMDLTGHLSVSVFLRYFHPGAVMASRAANILNDPPDASETSSAS
jgi:integrase